MGNKKISIIGAGPAGCYAAYLLAKHAKKFDIEIFEQKKKIGKIQCGGAITATIKKIDSIFRTKEFEKTVVNRIKENIFHSPHNKLVIRFKNPEYVVDRIKFDNFIANKARKAGAKINLGCRFIKIKERKEKIRFLIKKGHKEVLINTDILIGADGALSTVCKCLNTKRNLELAIEARCRGKFKKNTYEIFLGKEYGKFYAWIIPESANIARIGLFNDFKKFNAFIKKIDAKILDMRSGYVPINKPVKCQCSKDIYLIGDAGCNAKASTGGGIIPSLNSAKILAESIVKGKNFDKCAKQCKRDLYIHYIIRKILNKFSDKDYDKLFEFVKKDRRILKFLERGSRDEISLGICNLPLSFHILRYSKKLL